MSLLSKPRTSRTGNAEVLAARHQVDRLHHALGDPERLELALGRCSTGLQLGRRCWPRGVSRGPGGELLLSVQKKVDEIGLAVIAQVPQPRKTFISGGSEKRQCQLQEPGLEPHLPRIARAELTGVSQPPRARLEPPRSETGAREAYKHPVLVAPSGEQHWLAWRPLQVSVEVFVGHGLRWRCVKPCSVFSRGRRQPPRQRVVRGTDWRRRLLLLSLQGLAQCGVPRRVPEAVHLRLRHLL